MCKILVFRWSLIKYKIIYKEIYIFVIFFIHNFQYHNNIYLIKIYFKANKMHIIILGFNFKVLFANFYKLINLMKSLEIYGFINFRSGNPDEITWSQIKISVKISETMLKP